MYPSENPDHGRGAFGGSMKPLSALPPGPVATLPSGAQPPPMGPKLPGGRVPVRPRGPVAQ